MLLILLLATSCAYGKLRQQDDEFYNSRNYRDGGNWGRSIQLHRRVPAEKPRPRKICEPGSRKMVRCVKNKLVLHHGHRPQGGEHQNQLANVQQHPEVFLGKLSTEMHDVSGDVYGVGTNKLLIKKFVYDGTAPQTFFFASTNVAGPTVEGILIPYPSAGVVLVTKLENVSAVAVEPILIRKFNYDGNGLVVGFFYPAMNAILVPLSPGVNVNITTKLEKFNGDKEVPLTLPLGVEISQLKWFGVWCKSFNQSFGHILL